MQGDRRTSAEPLPAGFSLVEVETRDDSGGPARSLRLLASPRRALREEQEIYNRRQPDPGGLKGGIQHSR